ARLATPYPIRNGPLLSVRELLLVNGMTPELFAEVEPYVAVLPARELRINVNAAPVEVLAAVPGFSPELAERVVSRRLLAGPIVTPAEITSDPDLAPLFDRAEGGLAVNVIALYPEVVEIDALGRGGDSGPGHRVLATYTLRNGTLERLERREVGS
ncbi:MAG TPA: helix-hairpin-helix domain-containing protein, partial [Longimicrobiaceae bacterium]|nr:helix-hairpin-helix domain-containing protein [Longimicrobiaceae bacterium]